jgi:pimeloyl-ACP methyl ester carboxylesterase/predicted glycosyltransferase
MITPDFTGEQSRARYPDDTGYIEREGVKIFWERYGDGDPTLLFLPTWSIVHSRCWKAQIPYFARHARVLTFDGRGNGRSDRPSGAEAYAPAEFVADALAVMDATATERAWVVSVSAGAPRALMLGADHAERVEGLVFIGPNVSLPPLPPWVPTPEAFTAPRETYTGWEKFNQHYWQEHYEDFLEFFFGQIFTEPHSSKQIEDAVRWGLDTDPQTLVLTIVPPNPDRAAMMDLAGRAHGRSLVIHGTEDAIQPYGSGAALAELLDGPLATMVGSGHNPHIRDPVKVNLILREFIERRPTSVWTRAKDRPRRALYISSSIGLGHAQRDVAIVRELRTLVPGLEIDWLAQDPVTRVLKAAGERIHPASAELANESSHFESESAEHDLHAFQAWRRMDEILINNFMVFQDLVEAEPYDLWVGDEAWELDYYLHENPELKRAAYCWLTDFVGWLPMPDGGERETFLTADYNAEMVEHIARLPRLRDRAIFVGNPEDIVPDRLGPELPLIREWTGQHFEFAGYVSGFDPAVLADRDALRGELGYGGDERICIVSVGGTGVGEHLLRRVIDAHPLAAAQVPGLRTIVVAGPRIDPGFLPRHDGLEIVGYVHNLYRHLAACDLAVIQGGLTTAMELTANRRPFLYFPLKHHFEQNFHVRHRLDRYHAGRYMDIDRSPPTVIAAAIAEEIGREVEYLPVETDGARRAAARIAEML